MRRETNAFRPAPCGMGIAPPHTESSFNESNVILCGNVMIYHYEALNSSEKPYWRAT